MAITKKIEDLLKQYAEYAKSKGVSKKDIKSITTDLIDDFSSNAYTYREALDLIDASYVWKGKSKYSPIIKHSNDKLLNATVGEVVSSNGFALPGKGAIGGAKPSFSIGASPLSDTARGELDMLVASYMPYGSAFGGANKWRDTKGRLLAEIFEKFDSRDEKKFLAAAQGYLQSKYSRKYNLNPIDIDSLDATKRAAYLKEITTPNMKGFFPAYSEGFHSKPVTGFDTETDDRSKIIELAGLKLVYNFDKMRFEQLPNSANTELLKHFNSPTQELTRTEGIHGYTNKILNAITGNKDIVWTQNEYKDFISWATENDGILMGHNIEQADLSWLQGKPSRGFMREHFKGAFLDTLHLAEAIRGKAFRSAKTGESKGINKLQTIAKDFGVSAEQLGLQAHKGYNDVIVVFKVLEEFLKRYRGHPAVKEYLAGLKYGGIQSHRWRRPSDGYGYDFVREGFTISGVRGGHLMSDVYDEITPSEEEAQRHELAMLSELDEDGNSQGYHTVNLDEDDAYSDYGDYGYKSPKKMLPNIADAESNNVIARKFGFDVMKGLYKGGAEDATVKDVMQILLAGSDIALDRQKFETFLAAGKLVSGRAAQYDKWEELQKIRRQNMSTEYYDQKRREMGYYNHYAHYASQMGLDVKNAQDAMSAADTRINRYSYNKSYSRAKKSNYANRRSNARAAFNDAQADFFLANYAKLGAEGRRDAMAERILGHTRGFEDVKIPAFKYDRDASDFAEYTKWGTDENPAYKKEWAEGGEWSIAEQLQQHRDAFSKGLELRMNKSEALRRQQDYYMLPSQVDAFAERTHDMAEGLEEYNEALNKTIKTNQVATRALIKMAQAGKPFYNYANYIQAEIKGIGVVGDAIQGLAPRVLREGIGRYTTSAQEFLTAKKANWGYAYDTASNIGNMLTGAGGVMALTGVGTLPAMITSGVGAAINLGSNIIGGNAERKVTEASQNLASKINFISAGFNTLLAPIRLLRNALGGGLNIWHRLGGIWSTQYGMPITHLSGVSSSSYSAMLSSDTFLGMKAGTLNSIHNNISLGQAGLYTSGQFDAKRLVAAARLGVFSDVYGSLGGNSQIQFAHTVDSLLSQMNGASDAKKQEISYLASQIDPNLPNILERMRRFKAAGLYSGSFAGLQDGSAFGMRQWNMSSYENAKWEWTAGQFGVGKQQFGFAMKRLATPLWDMARPLVNIVNESLNELATALSEPGGSRLEKIKAAGQKFWGDVMEYFGFNRDTSLGDLWNKGIGWLKEKDGSDIGKLLFNILYKGLSWLSTKEAELIKLIEAPLSNIIRYFNDSKLKFDFSLDKGLTVEWKSAKDVAAEEKPAITKAYQKIQAEYKGWREPLQGSFESVMNNKYERANALNAAAALEDKGYAVGNKKVPYPIIAALEAAAYQASTGTSFGTHPAVQDALSKGWIVKIDDIADAQARSLTEGMRKSNSAALEAMAAAGGFDANINISVEGNGTIESIQSPEAKSMLDSSKKGRIRYTGGR